MIDIKLIRDNPTSIKKKISERGYEINLDKLFKLDKEWRSLKLKADGLRSQRNKISKEIAEAKSKNKPVSTLLKKAKAIPEKIQEIEKESEHLEKQRKEILHSIPNIQDDSITVGREEKNKVIKKHGKIPKFKFKIKNHTKLLEDLDLLDIKRATKLSGSGFYILKGDLAKLERSLIQFMLDFHVKNGFTEINPPQLVKQAPLFGTGQLPKFDQDVYQTTSGLYPIPTAEVPLANIYSNETLREENLPKKFVAFTQCYRTEAGRHGSETPGIFRLHQFEKVELVYLCKPSESEKLLEEMTKYSEKLLQMLKIPYRKILLATKDASFASAKTYDLEVWSPAMKKYLETSSLSNCRDFQARRMNTKFLEKKTNERKFIHTLNGSGLATPRLLIALVENNQQSDGSIKIPKVLQKYTGFSIIKTEKPKKKTKKK